MLAFLSYVREDAATVDRLREDFEEYGIECFTDSGSIAPGDPWEERIRVSIERCDFFLPCFSEHYSRRSSTWMNRELEMALERHAQLDRVGWILPILLSGDVPALPEGIGSQLRMVQWTDLGPDQWSENLGRLLAVMLPDADVRGAGLTDLDRRFSEGRPNERIRVLHQLVNMLDIPESLALVERGLRDPHEGVRTRTLSLLPHAGEKGAEVAARVMSDPETSWPFRVGLALSVTLHPGQGAPAVPAIIELLGILLSERDESVVPEPVEDPGTRAMVISEFSRTNAAMFIQFLGDIGDPPDLIRHALENVESDVPEIRDAIEVALRKLEI